MPKNIQENIIPDQTKEQDSQRSKYKSLGAPYEDKEDQKSPHKEFETLNSGENSKQANLLTNASTKTKDMALEMSFSPHRAHILN